MDAVKVRSYVPPVPVVGVPLRMPVVGLNVIPAGNAPVSLRVGAGVPVSVTVKLPADPTVNVELARLVIAGASSMVSVKLCVSDPATPPSAVKVKSYVPAVPADGVPLSSPVLELKEMPAGSGIGSVSTGVGKPVAVAVKLPRVPTVNVVLVLLVMTGV